MIPRTFPSTFAANGQQQMVVYSLPSITGLTAWIDYIPVKGVTTESATLENTYANGGYQVVDSLASLTGKQAWLDYIPVYEDASYTKPWSTDAGGYIPTSALAALLLDFTSGRLDPRITFSRTTNATLTNSAGLVANAPMNLLTFSEQFDNAAWSKINSASITANQTIAPNGTQTADLFSCGASASRIQQAVTTVSSTVYTISVYAKSGTANYVCLSSITASAGAIFNLLTGSVAATAGSSTQSITSVGNGWYRCSITYTATGTTEQAIFGASATATFTFGFYPNGDTGNTCSLWGAQLELGSTATTYNPTTVKNLLGYTEHFDNAAWTKSNASISATKVDDIYGQPFAQKLVESTANSTHFTRQAISPIANGVYTFSVYAKAAERSFIILQPFNDVRYAFFNLATGVVGSVNGSPLSTSIQSVGDGWYRCSITAASSGTTGDSVVYVSNANGAVSYTGDGTSGIYIFGAQLSDSASIDPYVYQPVAAPSSVAYYGPRFDYDPVTLAPKGLLIEEQRTNLLVYSEQLDNANWAKSALTVTANNATSPSGAVDADTLVSSGDAFINQFASGAASTTYTGSVWLRVTAGTRSVRLFRNDSGTGFSTTNVTVTTTWQRFSLTATSSGTATFIGFQVGGGGSIPNGATLEIWGAQLEAGAFATSYIPTVASQVTRAADSASMIGNNFARWYNVNEGTVFSNTLTLAAGSGDKYNWEIGDGTANNRFSAAGQTSNQDFYVITGGAVQANSNLAISRASAIKMAGAYKTNDVIAAYNGTLGAADTSVVLPIPNALYLGSARTSLVPLNGTISRIAYYNRRLSNTELQGITS